MWESLCFTHIIIHISHKAHKLTKETDIITDVCWCLFQRQLQRQSYSHHINTPASLVRCTKSVGLLWCGCSVFDDAGFLLLLETQLLWPSGCDDDESASSSLTTASTDKPSYLSAVMHHIQGILLANDIKWLQTLCKTPKFWPLTENWDQNYRLKTEAKILAKVFASRPKQLCCV